MIINLVVATTENGVIGLNGKMPWYMPADLKHFKHITTLGEINTVIMGRKTYDSIGHALPGRSNVIITRNKNKEETDYIDGVVCNTIDDALEYVQGLEYFLKSECDVHIIGGASIYDEFIKKNNIDFIHHTLIHTELDGDTFFHIPDGWVIKSEKSYMSDENNPYNYTFRVLTKG